MDEKTKRREQMLVGKLYRKYKELTSIVGDDNADHGRAEELDEEIVQIYARLQDEFNWSESKLQRVTVTIMDKIVAEANKEQA